MKKCCLFCDAYALWDGDYCCTWHMKILSYANDKYKAYNPDRIINNICDDYVHEGTLKHYNINIEVWNKCNGQEENNRIECLTTEDSNKIYKERTY